MTSCLDRAGRGPTGSTEQEGGPAYRPQAASSGFAKRASALAATSALAGTLALSAIVGTAALSTQARAQGVPAVSACAPVQIPASVLRDQILRPVVGGIVTPVQGTVNSLIGTVDDLLLAPVLALLGLSGPADLNIDVDTILNGVNGGGPLTIEVLAADGTLIGPGAPCLTTADGFQLD